MKRTSLRMMNIDVLSTMRMRRYLPDTARFEPRLYQPAFVFTISITASVDHSESSVVSTSLLSRRMNRGSVSMPSRYTSMPRTWKHEPKSNTIHWFLPSIGRWHVGFSAMFAPNTSDVDTLPSITRPVSPTKIELTHSQPFSTLMLCSSSSAQLDDGVGVRYW